MSAPEVMTPGRYLQLRREAAGLSIDDVAAQFVTEPRISERDRKSWLLLIECDAVPVGHHVVDTLATVFPFDADVLLRLDAFRAKLNWDVPAICSSCGCSDLDACMDDGSACHWAGVNACSACVHSGRLTLTAEEGLPI